MFYPPVAPIYLKVPLAALLNTSLVRHPPSFNHLLRLLIPRLADVQFDWEVANVDGLRFNSGLWPPPTTPFPERYGESLPRQISKHEEDPLWPFASRDISQSVPHHDSLLGESFDSLMKSINQQPNYNPSKRAEPRDFPYFTSAHM